MIQTKAVIALFLVGVFSASSATSFATDTTSPKPSTNATHTKQLLTDAQKAAILDANSIFAAAKVNAQNGFDRAIADAQAVRDQAISIAGTNAAAIRAAKQDFREFYKNIYDAYKTALSNARSVRDASLAAVKAAKKG